MCAKICVGLFITMMLDALPEAKADLLPGTPLGGATFAPQDIVAGINILPGLVQAGDVVLLENPLGTHDPTNWSDAVRFFNFMGLGLAYLISDSGNAIGIPSLQVSDGNDNPVVPSLSDTLSANNTFLTELQNGTGTDNSDVTSYIVTGAAYSIHSNAALVDSPDAPFISPWAEIIAGGKKPKNRLITFVEDFLDHDQKTVNFVLNSPPLSLIEPGTVGTESDRLIFTPHANSTTINLFSVNDGDDSDFDPKEVERFNAINTDEATTTYMVIGVDTPEPQSLVLLGIGLLGMVATFLRRKQLG